MEIRQRKLEDFNIIRYKFNIIINIIYLMKLEQNLQKYKQLRQSLSIKWFGTQRFQFFNQNIKSYFFQTPLNQSFKFIANLPKITNSPSKLEYLYHRINKQTHKISKNIYFKSSTTNIIPFHLKTNQLIAVKLKNSQLIINHIPNSQKQTTFLQSITQYQNTWHLFVQTFNINRDQIQYQCYVTQSKKLSKFQYNLFLHFITNYIENNLKNIQLEAKLIEQSEQIQKIQKIIIQKPILLHPKHNNPNILNHQRINQLNQQQKNSFLKLKNRFPDATDNQLCRFLIAKNFQVQQTINDFANYLSWKQSMKKYTLQDFKQFHDKKLFRYIGTDRVGHPVVLNFSSLAFPDQLDQQRYSLYYMYFLQIYIPSLMAPGIDQMLIIAQTANFTSKNFKLSLMSRNITDALNYSPQRQYKLIAVNASWFGLTVWRVLKALIPEKTTKKIQVIGSDKKQIYEILLKQMDQDVIPDFLGGKNKIFGQ